MSRNIVHCRLWILGAQEAYRRPGEGGVVPVDGGALRTVLLGGLLAVVFAESRRSGGVFNGATDIPATFDKVSFMPGDCVVAARMA